MGRPLGSRNKATLFGKEWAGEAIAQAKAVLQSRLDEGDPAAAQFVVKHFCPKPRGGLVTLDLPQIKSAAGLLQAQNLVLQAVARGEIATGDGQALMSMMMQIAKTLRVVTQEKQEQQEQEDRLERFFDPPIERDDDVVVVRSPFFDGDDDDEVVPPAPPPPDPAPFAALKVPPDGTSDGLPDDQCSLRRSRGAAVAAAAG